MSRVLVLLLLCALCLPYLWFVVPTAPVQPYQLPYQLVPASQQHAAAEEMVRRAKGLAARDGDLSTLINLSNFRWLEDGHPPAGCSPGSLQPGPLLLAMVSSAPGHFEERRFIRETWGSPAVAPPPGLVLRFTVGLTDPDTQRLLDKEQRQHGDLVQGNFQDSYRNMTYKHVMALKWMVYYCPTAKYLIKMDDDVLVNSPALMEFLRHDLSPFGARDLLLCAPVQLAFVKRSYRSKWRVTYAEHPNAVYPTYCSGYSILYSPDAIFRLYEEAQLPGMSYFWVDDVLVTGILAQRVGLRHASWESYVLAESDVDRVISGALEPSFLFGPYDLPIDLNRHLWQRVTQHRLID